LSTAPPGLVEALSDRYRLDREIGVGGMATVYLAYDLRHDRKVAVKVLRPDLAAIIGGERFLAEIRTTANLQHPHILPLHDSGEADGKVFYVMPFVEGESLRRRLQHEHQLPVDEAVRITREVASALDYAHRHGVVHRDIKPENILLHDGQALVADFGIALAVSRSDGGTRMTETGMSLGTPHYMAPEQAMGEREISPRADVYALGCVLYECLCGEPPFTGPTAQAIIARVMTEQPRGLQIQRRTIPAHVEAATRTALEKLPADRFASAAAFSEALANPSYALSGAGAFSIAEPGMAGGRAWDPRAWSWPTRVLAGAALGFAALSAWLATPARDETAAPLPVVAFQAIDSVPGRLRPVVSVTGAVAWVQRPQGIYVRSPGATSAILLAGTEGAVIEALDFSPTESGWCSRWPRRRLLRLRASPCGASPPRAAFRRRSPATWLGTRERGCSPPPGARTTTSISARRTFARDWVPCCACLPLAECRTRFSPWTRPSSWATRCCRDNRTMLVGLAERRASGRASSPWISSDEIPPSCWQMRFPRQWSPTGHVLTVRHDGTLLALPYDPAARRVLGAPVPVADSIVTEALRGRFSVASNGTLAYVRGPSASTGTGDLRIALIDDTGGIEYLPLPATDHFDGGFSPDGRRLAYIRNDHLWLYDMDVGTHRQLTRDGSNHHNPVWSPDGKRVAFRADRAGHAIGDVYSLEPEGDGAVTRLGGAPGASANPSQWLADNTLLVYTDGRETDILRLQVDSDPQARPVLNADWVERAPQVSPDGRWIAYIASEDGSDRVYVRRWPDLSAKVLVSGVTLPVSHTLWSRDSRTLYAQEGEQLIGFGVEPGDAGIRVTSRRVVRDNLRGPVSAMHPDGRRLLHFSRGTAAEDEGNVIPRLIIVSNWHEVLRQRLGSER
jgi:eukaryotic-like serine/threonine-protein kinase